MSNKPKSGERLAILIVGWEVSFEERFGALVEMAGGVVKAAKLCGVSRNTLYLWTKSDGKIPLNAALKLAEAAGVTLDWVATGWDRRPDMPAVEIPPEKALDVAAIPPLTGLGEDRFYLPNAALAALGAPGEALRFIRACGDAMAPTIQPGAVVLVDTAQRSWTGDSVYALSVAGLVLLRRLSRGVEGGFMLISDNPRYPTERLADLDALQIEGRVAWTEHRM